MTSLTVRDLLDMPVVRQAGPVVLAGERSLGVGVRWVHTSELADIAPLLRDGDLVLSTGIALPGTPEGLSEFASSLAGAGAAGLVLELGRRWTTVPDTLVEACDAHGLPLVALAHEVRFAAIAQAVGELLVDEQVTELREVERIHETLTELSLSDAGPREVLAAVQRLAGATVVLETDQHRVLDYVSGPESIEHFLENWQTRSRRVELTSQTLWDEDNGWLVTRLGPQGRGLGRLVLESPRQPPPRHVALVERAAAALALHRLRDRDRDHLVRRTHHELLEALQQEPLGADVLRRCDLAGFPTAHRQFVGLSIRLAAPAPQASPSRPAPVAEAVEAVIRACGHAGVPVLAAQRDDDIAAVLSIGKRASAESVTDRLAGEIAAPRDLVVGAGRTATSAPGIGRTIREARHVLDSVPAGVGPSPERRLFRLPDVHIRGLLSLWGDDDRLRLFVSRELDALTAYDAEHESNLTETLRALLVHGSKADAAAELHLSRAAFYSRLARIERQLGVRLDDAETRTSLHVALIAADLAEQRGRGQADDLGQHRSP